MTANEFFSRLKTDEAFAKEVREKVVAKHAEGTDNVYDTLIPVAAEYGCDLTNDDIDTMIESASEEISEEDLGKVAGGTMCAVISLAAFLFSAAVGITIYTTIDDNG